MSEQKATDVPGRDAGALCLQCGMCCDGTLFSYAKLNPDEIDHAKKLRLRVLDGQDRFLQRCNALGEDKKCGVYAERPRTCSGFRCTMLAQYMRGALTLDECLGRLDQISAFIARMEPMISPPETPLEPWDMRAYLNEQIRGALVLAGLRPLVMVPPPQPDEGNNNA